MYSSTIDCRCLRTHDLHASTVSVAFRAVRFVFLLCALNCPLRADLIARFQTSQGVVDAILQYEKVPQAVGNFVTLAEGTRPWIDEKTGAITHKPFYDGTKIHRISNNDNFKFAQGGSRIGDASDGPGYTIKDEFDDTLTHVPYVLSMGNKGPNSNGSGFFFTGNIAIPSYDESYTLFGIVTDPASRAAIDAIIAAGADGTTIHQITILRTDAAAIAFDEHAHNLPTVPCRAAHRRSLRASQRSGSSTSIGHRRCLPCIRLHHPRRRKPGGSRCGCHPDRSPLDSSRPANHFDHPRQRHPAQGVLPSLAGAPPGIGYTIDPRKPHRDPVSWRRKTQLRVQLFRNRRHLHLHSSSRERPRFSLSTGWIMIRKPIISHSWWKISPVPCVSISSSGWVAIR